MSTLTTAARVLALDATGRRETADDLATEEPLELRVAAAGRTQTIAVTMRTPGCDFELAAGFLFAEGIVGSREQIREISSCIDPLSDPGTRNAVRVDLAFPALPNLERLERHFVTNSSCGVCGKAGIAALARRFDPLQDGTEIAFRTIVSLPERMRAAQRVFSTTGGLHAAALFDTGGTLLALREDVGRHNALDKILGWALLNGKLPLAGSVLMLSGRSSYELVQKSIAARIPIVCSVSAPSSLAAELASAFGLTLAGFVRDGRCNVYSEPWRIIA